MMMVLTMSLGAASEVRLDRVFLSDVTAGELYAYVQLENTMDAQLENVHVTVTLPELGVRRRATLYQVDEDSYAHARLYLDLPDVKGEYIARVTVSDGYGEVRRTVHRYVYII
mgnify:FL=1